MGSPSTSRVTVPVGVKLPAGGMPTVSVTVAVMVAPGDVVKVEGTTARLVVLFCVLMLTGGVELAAA